MATWVPTCAPNLWGHPFWWCPNYSRVMHAASLGNPNPNGQSWLPRLFTRVTPSYAIHTTRMGTLWLRPPPTSGCFTDNWCLSWYPPFVAQFNCLNHRLSMSHRPYSVAEDTSAYLGDRRPTTNRHTGSCRLWGPAYVADIACTIVRTSCSLPSWLANSIPHEWPLMREIGHQYGFRIFLRGVLPLFACIARHLHIPK